MKEYRQKNQKLISSPKGFAQMNFSRNDNNYTTLTNENAIIYNFLTGEHFFLKKGTSAFDIWYYIQENISVNLGELLALMHRKYITTSREVIFKDTFKFLNQMAHSDLVKYNLSTYTSPQVLLINPQNPLKNAQVWESISLGLLYLAAVLDNEGITCKILDLNRDISMFKLIPSVLKILKPDIIGITCTSMTYLSALAIATIIKEFSSETIIIMGGPHVSFLYEAILSQHNVIDFIVIGEGEHTFVELVKNLTNNNSAFNIINGIAYKQNNHIVVTKRRMSIDNLDALPFPDPFKFLYYPPSCVNIPFRILAKRGCPFKCIYCSSSSFWGNKMRLRTPQNLVTEIEYYTANYNAKEIVFNDDIFTIPLEWIKDFCKLMLARNVQIVWGCDTRIDSVDHKLLKKMFESGCRTILYGIESINPVVLRNIKKKLPPLHRIEETIKMTEDIGIKPVLSFIIGLPGENKDSIKNTIEWLKSLNLLKRAEFLFLNSFPGTPFSSSWPNLGFKLTANTLWYNLHTPIFTSQDLSLQEQVNLYLEIIDELKKKEMIKKNPFIVSHQIGNKIFCKDIKNKKWHMITGIGIDIWNMIAECDNINEIVRRISLKYKKSIYKIQNDINHFFRLLDSRGLISVTETLFQKKLQNSPKFEDHEKKDIITKLNNEALKKNIILKVDFSLTYKCPLRCKHCYAGHAVKTPSIKDELTASEIKEIIKGLVAQGCFEVCFTGGDPLFKEGIIEILDFTKQIDCYVRILTSGYRLSSELRKAFVNNPHLNDIEISFFGISKESHEFITQIPGSFKRVCETIKSLTSTGIKIIIKYIIMKHNINEAPKLSALANELGADFVYSGGLIYPRLNFDVSPQKLMANTEELIDHYLWFIKSGYSIDCGDHNCKSVGKTICSISPSGDVKPCEFFPTVIGNIKDNSFTEIWSSKKAESLRKLLTENKICNNCAINDVCPICPAILYLDTKGFNKPSTKACKIAGIISKLSVDV